MRKMRVPPGRSGSWEEVLHRAKPADKLLIFNPREYDPLLLEERGHRAIGVVYRPAHEGYGNYVPTVLPYRYDAVLFMDESHALAPLHMPVKAEHEVPETYPTGL